MNNTHDSESPESSRSTDSLNVETDGMWSEERLASLLLRILGVYFLAWAFISGIEEAVRFFVAISVSKIGLDTLFPHHWTYLSYLAAEFTLGAYLLFGGQWVFEKVLVPVIPRPENGDHANEDQDANSDLSGKDESPSIK
jgi:hypothetical protein